MPQLRRDGREVISARQLEGGNEWNSHRRRTADGLGQEADHIVEVTRGAQAAVPPRRVAGTRTDRGAGLSFREETLHHRGTDRIDAADNQRIDVVIEWVAERRAEQHAAGWAALVVVVDD